MNYVDPSGHSITAILICAAIGAILGFGATVLVDYMDDGEVFNGSISASGYIANTIVGGVFGALFGAIGGALPSLSIAPPATMTFAYAGVGVVGTAAISIESGVLTAVGLLVGLSFLASVIGKSGGYKISHHYPNDHDPIHVHIEGDDIVGGETRVDLNGEVLRGNSPLTRGAKRAFIKLYDKILKALLPWM